jgi:hypothetical protein
MLAFFSNAQPTVKPPSPWWGSRRTNRGKKCQPSSEFVLRGARDFTSLIDVFTFLEGSVSQRQHISVASDPYI